MLGIVVATHGQLSTGIIDACEVIIGETKSIEAVSLKSGEDVNTFGSKIKTAIENIKSDEGVIVFVDLLSASPYNQSRLVMNDLDETLRTNIYIMSGVNLPMVLEAINCQFLQMNAKECVDILINAGKENIQVYNMLLNHNNDEEDDF